MSYYHKSMTADKWNAYPRQQQILMIGSELARAKGRIQKCCYDDARDCYMRAIELTALTADDVKWKKGLKELLRFKEMLGQAALFNITDLNLCTNLYKVLLSWDAETIKVQV